VFHLQPPTPIRSAPTSPDAGPRMSSTGECEPTYLLLVPASSGTSAPWTPAFASPSATNVVQKGVEALLREYARTEPIASSAHAAVIDVSTTEDGAYGTGVVFTQHHHSMKLGFSARDMDALVATVRSLLVRSPYLLPSAVSSAVPDTLKSRVTLSIPGRAHVFVTVLPSSTSADIDASLLSAHASALCAVTRDPVGVRSMALQMLRDGATLHAIVPELTKLADLAITRFWKASALMSAKCRILGLAPPTVQFSPLKSVSKTLVDYQCAYWDSVVHAYGGDTNSSAPASSASSTASATSTPSKPSYEAWARAKAKDAWAEAQLATLCRPLSTTNANTKKRAVDPSLSTSSSSSTPAAADSSSTAPATGSATAPALKKPKACLCLCLCP